MNFHLLFSMTATTNEAMELGILKLGMKTGCQHSYKLHMEQHM